MQPTQVESHSRNKRKDIDIREPPVSKTGPDAAPREDVGIPLIHVWVPQGVCPRHPSLISRESSDALPQSCDCTLRVPLLQTVLSEQNKAPSLGTLLDWPAGSSVGTAGEKRGTVPR